ncbi:hypothetical protein RJ639_009591 [Escallonia herrerae]|uniref:Glycosyltransferase n=1 Tax=Escallonia herrerae TaxID=1293975 RepID=A0AA88VQM3_9ASTE|nr:hypothetical protein RJ639_009591 [Escallonia herrerae]
MVTTCSADQHVAVLAFPFATHPDLLLRLARRLAAAAPTVTFSFFSTAKSNASLFAVPSPDNIRPCSVSDGIPEGYVFSGKPQEDIDLFLKVAPEELGRCLRAAERNTGRKITCVVADAFLWFSGEMAEEMHVPWVPLWTAAAASLSVHFYTDLIRETVGLEDLAGREDEILKFIPGIRALRLGDLPAEVLFGDLGSSFSTMLHKMGQSLHRAAAVPINSFEEIDPVVTKDLKARLRKVLNIGPFNLTSPPRSSISDEYGCIPWLDTQQAKSVAYIGFGTVATPPPNELVALAEALDASDTPFLWSLKDSFKMHLPKGFLERMGRNGKIVPWAPQVQVLAHGSIGVFISHCGWSSVSESIAAGVPVIGRPFFGDQLLDSWMVENEWEIGVRIEGGVFTKMGTMRALEQVLSSEKGHHLREQVMLYKELAHKAVGPNGSSTKNFKALLEIITRDSH